MSFSGIQNPSPLGEGKAAAHRILGEQAMRSYRKLVSKISEL
jgi:hypothetical protein